MKLILHWCAFADSLARQQEGNRRYLSLRSGYFEETGWRENLAPRGRVALQWKYYATH
jgi:hypothetical protein